ncbi:MAG: hypothetical protein E7395_02180 [Ruminococcaceae bacterium]|nr:hypothetical protein [Oscillospiraceae bacterium]
MKKVFSIILIVFIFATVCVGVCAYESNEPNTIKIYLNGKLVDTKDTNAMLINGRTMVPARAVFEAMGCKVNWNATIQTVQVSGTFDGVALKIGNKTMSKVKRYEQDNVIPVEMEVPAQIDENNRTLIPLRAVAEALDAVVITNNEDWNKGNRNIYIESQYDTVEDDKERGIVKVSKNEEYWYVDYAKTAVTKKYDFIGNIDELGRVKVGTDTAGKLKYGYINMNNLSNFPIKPFIPCQYDSIEPIDGGFACFSGTEYSKLSDSGATDLNSRIIYQEITPFVNGKAIAKNSEGKYGYIDTFGNEVVKFEYDEFRAFCNGFAFAKKDNTYFSINNEDATIVELKYDEIKIIDDNTAIVVKSENSQKSYHIINAENKTIANFDDSLTSNEEKLDDTQVKVTYILSDGRKVAFTYTVDNVPSKGIAQVTTNADGAVKYIDVYGNNGIVTE